MSYLHTKKKCIITFNRPPHPYFWDFTKMLSLKVSHPLKIYQHTKFHGPTLNGLLCINIKSLNICYFGMVKAMELGVASRLPSVARPAY
jgi:hypothetical protein